MEKTMMEAVIKKDLKIRNRGFEKIKEYEDLAEIPTRSTKYSAGYDFKSIEDVIVPSLTTQFDNFKSMLETMLNLVIEVSDQETFDEIYEKINNGATNVESLGVLMNEIKLIEEKIQSEDGLHDKISKQVDILLNNMKPVLVKTGIKAYMQPGEYLQLANRSSNPKKGLFLANGIGVIDADYYNNENNDGHIMFQYINLSPDAVTIKKGDKIGQGIFQQFLITDDDFAEGTRTGGFGSTGK